MWQLILKLDDEMCAKGVPPKERHFELPVKAMEALGFKSFVTGGAGVPPLLEQIRAMHRTLFRSQDIAVGGVHGGAFMFRGIATNVYVPVIFGRVAINPHEFCDLSDQQVQWLRSNPEHDRSYVGELLQPVRFRGLLSAYEWLWCGSRRCAADAAALRVPDSERSRDALRII